MELTTKDLTTFPIQYEKNLAIQVHIKKIIIFKIFPKVMKEFCFGNLKNPLKVFYRRLKINPD